MLLCLKAELLKLKAELKFAAYNILAQGFTSLM